MKFTVIKYLAGLFIVSLLTACIDNGSDSNTTTASQNIPIIAAGIKGPLAFADAKIYQFDPSFPGFYDESSPLSSAISDQFAEINGLSVPRDSQPPYILSIGGPDAVDLNSAMAPVISTLVTVVTKDMLNNGRPVYATPLTTLVFHMARHGAGTTVNARNFIDRLNDAASRVGATFAISPDVAIDVFSSPVIINDDTNTLSRQEEAVHHRAALEAFATKVHALARPNQGTSADDIIDLVAMDLQSDGVIDNKASGTTIGDIDSVLLC